MSDSVYYNSLLDLVCKQAISPEFLRVLKDQFKTQIKSVRRLDAIASVRDLVNVLKKRACIESGNLSELENIAELLGLPLPSKTNPLRNCTHPVQPRYRREVPEVRPRLEMPAVRPIPEIPEVQPYNYRLNEDILPPPVTDGKTRVYHEIAYRIGEKWKYFARNLGLLESELDALETRYKDVSERVFRVLYFFEQNCDRRQWKTQLLDALVNARRKDLKQRANLIFDTHGC